MKVLKQLLMVVLVCSVVACSDDDKKKKPGSGGGGGGGIGGTLFAGGGKDGSSDEEPIVEDSIFGVWEGEERDEVFFDKAYGEDEIVAEENVFYGKLTMRAEFRENMIVFSQKCEVKGKELYVQVEIPVKIDESRKMMQATVNARKHAKAIDGYLCELEIESGIGESASYRIEDGALYLPADSEVAEYTKKVAN